MTTIESLGSLVPAARKHGVPHVTDEQDVASVVVDGKVLMREHEMLTIDTQRVAAEANALATKIQTALKERNE